MRALLASGMLLLASCAADPVPPMHIDPEVVRSTLHYAREYILQAGDQLEISVFHVPEYNKTVTVRADGFVSLPIIGDFKMAGLTVPGADKELARRLNERLVDPDVTVNVMNPRPASVFVLGDVQRPGPVALRDAPTAALAIAAVGGVARTASLDSVAVIHLEADGTLSASMIQRPQSGTTAFYMALTSMPLENGDVVVVPESTRSEAMRFIQDFITTPLSGVNQFLTPYYELRLLNTIR